MSCIVLKLTDNGKARTNLAIILSVYKYEECSYTTGLEAFENSLIHVQ
jgi:hypothetical protein